MIPIFIFVILLFPVPALIGYLFRNINHSTRSLPFYWVSGQVLLWALFQLLCVPFILLEQPFSKVVLYFNILTAILVVFSLFYLFYHSRHRHPKTAKHPKGKSAYILWGVFFLLLAFQLFMAIFYAYEEGDDAFYVAISTIAVDSDGMYDKLPYTGGTTGLSARHGLAPFPIWLSYLARMSGIPAVTVAQVTAPLVLIVMAYAIYYLIGKILLTERLHMLPFFMILTEIIVILGGYSVYSAENFLLVRTAQGKAVIANIILPFIILLLLIMLNKIHNSNKIGPVLWLLLALTAVAGCLCSTLGTILTCMLLGIVGLCTAFSYRKLWVLFPLAACCILPLGYALLYFMME